MLRYRLVVGMKDVALSEHLQIDFLKCQLEKVKHEVRQKEVVQEQQHLMQAKPNGRSEMLEAVGITGRAHGGTGRRGRGRTVSTRTSHNPIRGQAGHSDDKNSSQQPLCTRCRKPPHSPGAKCRASAAVCHKCHRKGHY